MVEHLECLFDARTLRDRASVRSLRRDSGSLLISDWDQSAAIGWTDGRREARRAAGRCSAPLDAPSRLLWRWCARGQPHRLHCRLAPHSLRAALVAALASPGGPIETKFGGRSAQGDARGRACETGVSCVCDTPSLVRPCVDAPAGLRYSARWDCGDRSQADRVTMLAAGSRCHSAAGRLSSPTRLTSVGAGSHERPPAPPPRTRWRVS